MRLPIDRKLAEAAVGKMIPNALFDPLSGPLSGNERVVAQRIAIDLLSGTEYEPIGIAEAEKWAVQTYGRYIQALPFEPKKAVTIDVASSPEQSNLLIERYVQSLFARDQTGRVPIRDVVKDVPTLESDRARDVSSEIVRLFLAAYRLSKLTQLE